MTGQVDFTVESWLYFCQVTDWYSLYVYKIWLLQVALVSSGVRLSQQSHSYVYL